jgi:predicted RNase H-like nuclease (RuvC/YqgF family)
LQERLDNQILNVNSTAQRQQKAFQTYSDNIFGTLTSALKLQNDELLNYFGTVSTQMQTAAKEQQEIFKQKLNETSQLVEELKKLTDIKKGIENFERATKEQNGKIEELTRSIYKLAQKEISGGSVPLPIPKWVKITGVIVGSLVSVTCIAVLAPLLVEWITKLVN